MGNLKWALYALMVMGGSGTLSYYTSEMNTKAYSQTIILQEEINKNEVIMIDPSLIEDQTAFVYEILFNQLEEIERISKNDGRPDIRYFDAVNFTMRIHLRTNKKPGDITVKYLQAIGVQKEGAQISNIIRLKLALRK